MRCYGILMGRMNTDEQKPRLHDSDSEHREAEKLYRTVLEHAGQIFYDHDLRSGNVAWTGALERLTGYTSDEFAAIDQRMWEQLIHEDDRALAVLSLCEAVERKDPYVFEYRVRRKDGSYLSVETKGFPLKDSAGVVCRMVGIIEDITDRKKTEEQLRISEARFRSIFQNTVVAVAFSDSRGDIILTNKAFQALTGFGREELIGRNFMTILSPEGAYDTEEAFRVLSGNTQSEYRLEIPYRRKDDGVTWFDLVVSVIRDTHGSPLFFVAFLVDITDRHRAEEKTKLLTAAVESATDWVLVTDREGTIQYVNKSVERMTGYTKEEMLGKKPNIMKSGKHDNSFYKKMWDTILSGKSFQSIMTNRRKDGELFEVYHTITPVRDAGGTIQHFIATSKDISAQKDLADQLHYLAYYDDCTGLPNRTLFIDRVAQSVARSDFKQKLTAVLIADIDRFVPVNEAYGFEVADAVLKETGRRIAAAVRDGDTVARIGNDEFAVLLVDVAELEDVVKVVEKLMHAVESPIAVDAFQILVTVSIGVSVAPADGTDAKVLIRNADLALQKTQQKGKRSYQFYTEDLNAFISRFVKLENDLFRACKNEEFMLYYQPYWDIESGRITGMEALIRWNSPEHGMVSPGRFIPVLEETGFIIEVGKWISQSAIEQLRTWRERGCRQVPVSINLSVIQFRQKDLADMIAGQLVANNVPPSLLTLEITESAFMEDVGRTQAVLNRLREIGCDISIDDFGTGYSSLAYLKRFPVNNLKIDISFIRDIATDNDTASIVAAIVSMARTLNLKTVAEGVETEDQRNVLRFLRCNVGQGFLLYKPMPPELIEPLLLSSD